MGEGFPTKNLIQPYAGQTDSFVTQINPQGTDLVFSTFIGGSCYGLAEAVTEDPRGNIYVAGRTNSDDFPVKNTFQPQKQGVSNCDVYPNMPPPAAFDVFVVKITPSGGAASLTGVLPLLLLSE
jgi:hypothetical protein